MNCDEIIAELRCLSSEKHKANVVKMGIPEECSLGVSTGDIRTLAKAVGKSDELADQLWHSGLHEAKLLAVLLYDKKTVDEETISSLMDDVISWDLCDHLCKNLILKYKGYEVFIRRWCDHQGTYFKRAAYTLMAAAAVHDKSITENDITCYLDWIRQYSDDDRDHVKKAVSWALREIGKRDFDCQEKALMVAYELKDNGTKAQGWIGKDAIKELENLVQVEGRGRLISRNTAMGKEK